MKKFVFILSIMLLTCLFFGCVQEPEQPTPQPILLRYADNQPEDYPTTQAAYYFADLVKERTQGRIEILVYANAKLGDETEVVEQVQLGMIDFARISSSIIDGIYPRITTLMMPYLYENAEHMWRVLDGEIGNTFIQGLQEYDLIGLSWYDAGARSFYTTEKQIKSLEDFNGLNIRVLESNLVEDLVRALGATPVKVAYKDVYSSMQSGVIDGAENNWPSYESMGHYAVAPYLIVDEHLRIPELQLASKATMDRLSVQDQKIILEAAKESALYERKLWTEKEKASEKIVRENGTIVTELSSEEREKFIEAMQPLYDEYCAQDIDLLQEIRRA